MPRGGFRPGAGRPRKARPGEDPKPTATRLRAKLPPSAIRLDPIEAAPLADEDDAKAYLIRVMNSPNEDPRMRQDAAKALLPYQHPKIAEVGKKEQRNKDAQEIAGSKFTPGAPPKLIAAGGKKV